MATAGNSVTISILGETGSINSSLSSVGKSLGGLSSKSRQAGAAASRAGEAGGIGFAAMLGPIGAVTAALGGVFSMMSLINKGIEVNSQIEDAKNSIATLLSLNGDVREFSERFAESGDIIDQLREKGKYAEASFSDLLNTMTSVSGTAFSAGISDTDDQIDMIVAVSQALKVLGGDQQRIGVEMSRMLSGTFDPSDKLRMVFQGQEKELKAAVASGNALGFIMNALGPVTKDAAQGMGTWSSLITFAKEAWDDFAQAVTQPLFEALKPALEWMVEKLMEVTQIIRDWSGMLQDAFADGELGAVVGDALMLGFKVAVNFLFRAFDGLMTMIGAGLLATFGMVVKPEFWVGILEIFGGLGIVLLATMAVVALRLQLGLHDAFAPFQEKFIAVVIFIGTYLKNIFIMIGNVFKLGLLVAGEALLDLIKPIADMLGKGDKIDAAKQSMAKAKDEAVEKADAAQKENANAFTNKDGGKTGWEVAQEKAGSVMDAKRGILVESIEAGKQAVEFGKKNISAGSDKLGPMMNEGLGKMKDGFNEGFNSKEDFLDTSGEKDRLAKRLADAKAKREKEGDKKKTSLPGKKKNGKEGKKGEDEVSSIQMIGGGGHLGGKEKLPSIAGFGSKIGLGGGTGAASKTPEQVAAEGQTAMIAILSDSRTLLREIRDRIGGDNRNNATPNKNSGSFELVEV